MIHVQTVESGPIATNCYILHDDQGRAVVIDPGYDYELILEALAPFKTTHILLTHGHFDHIGGVKGLKEATGAQVLIHEAESKWLTDPALNLSEASAAYVPWLVDGPAPDDFLTPGESLDMLDAPIQVRFTPGHSPGHVSFVIEGIIIGGDVLFAGSVGRTDLPGGDPTKLIQSIRTQFMTLPDHYQVFPGHGPKTTIEHEKKFNPFI